MTPYERVHTHAVALARESLRLKRLGDHTNVYIAASLKRWAVQRHLLSLTLPGAPKPQPPRTD